MRARSVVGLTLALATQASYLPARAEAPSRRVAVLEAGERGARRPLAAALGEGGMNVLDEGMVDAAARGAGYVGSTNLTLADARRLAEAIGADALVIEALSVVERSPEGGPPTGDAFLALFLVDGMTGKLLRYKGFQALASTTAAARGEALRRARSEVSTWPAVVAAAASARLDGRDATPWAPGSVDLTSTPEGGDGTRPPRFFKRPTPRFTDDADRAHAVATVDLVVQFNADGSYGPIEVVRWAGYGLDEAAAAAVRSSTFWPASVGGAPVSARALLRYNFRFRDR
jgi:hypothetical protein